MRVATERARVVLVEHLAIVERSAKITASIVSMDGAVSLPGAAKTMIGAEVEIVMPLGGLIDVATEKTRIAKDITKAEREIATLEKKLGNADFLARAPEDVVAEQKSRLADEQTRRQRLVDALVTLGGST
jgi:valyl-tRNA synthetase